VVVVVVFKTRKTWYWTSDSNLFLFWSWSSNGAHTDPLSVYVCCGGTKAPLKIQSSYTFWIIQTFSQPWVLQHCRFGMHSLVLGFKSQTWVSATVPVSIKWSILKLI